MSIGALLLTAPLMYAQYYANYFKFQVDAKNVFGSTIMSAWLGWWFTVDEQQIVSWSIDYGGASYYFLDSVSLGQLTATGSTNSLTASLPVTFQENLGPFNIQTIQTTLYNYIYYYGGNNVVVYYGYSGHTYWGSLTLPVSITFDFDL